MIMEPTTQMNSLLINLELSLRLLPGYQMRLEPLVFFIDYFLLHADINEAAIWFNQNKLQLSIIDFDSGL